MILEVACGNIESAFSAHSGGADRIELCSSLSEGGLSPSFAMLNMVVAAGIKTFAMVRPREGDFIYSDIEFKLMLYEIALFRSAGANGIVSGILTKDGEIDFERTRELISAASPLPFTFHRAFDLTADPLRSLQVLIELKADKLLTSGQSSDAFTGRKIISELVKLSNGRISIVAGAGVNADNVESICIETGVNEIHLSGKILKTSEMKVLRSSVAMGKQNADESSYYVTDEKIIRRIRNIIDK